MNNIPSHYNDAKALLSERGFSTSNVWYHGTSSALWESIRKVGLQRSGDAAMKQAEKQTMATIGGNYTESIEPVFITPSKTLAYYWATQKAQSRNMRLGNDETPIIIQITLPDSSDDSLDTSTSGAINTMVKPDVGIASLLLIKEGEHYMTFLSELYKSTGLANLASSEVNPEKVDRMDYLSKLGAAYINTDIAADHLVLLEP